MFNLLLGVSGTDDSPVDCNRLVSVRFAAAIENAHGLRTSVKGSEPGSSLLIRDGQLVTQTDAEFDATLNTSFQKIYDASIT